MPAVMACCVAYGAGRAVSGALPIHCRGQHYWGLCGTEKPQETSSGARCRLSLLTYCLSQTPFLVLLSDIASWLVTFPQTIDSITGQVRKVTSSAPACNEFSGFMGISSLHFGVLAGEPLGCRHRSSKASTPVVLSVRLPARYPRNADVVSFDACAVV